MIDAALWRARYPPMAEPDWYTDDEVRAAALIFTARAMASALYGLCVAIGPRYTPLDCIADDERMGIPEENRHLCGGCADGWVRWLRWYDSARAAFGPVEDIEAAVCDHAGTRPTRKDEP